MQYFGGKQRISKPLAVFLNSQLSKDQIFVDLFCGSCNVVSNIRQDVKRIANDKNEYLIAMWKHLQEGGELPTSVSEEEYHRVKHLCATDQETMALKSFVGFGCSFAGKWWGGYARSNTAQNYAKCAYNSAMRKSAKMKDVEFHTLDYSEMIFTKGSTIYCDIPYKNTTGYSAVGKFDHEEFYKWCKEEKSNNRILISEYKHNVPCDGTILWELESKQDIRSSGGVKQKTCEVVFEFV